jgi:hypothetical protein
MDGFSGRKRPKKGDCAVTIGRIDGPFSTASGSLEEMFEIHPNLDYLGVPSSGFSLAFHLHPSEVRYTLNGNKSFPSGNLQRYKCRSI